jgi:aryl-alcohol dehydrogenase-like predicted oxidoreductase
MSTNTLGTTRKLGNSDLDLTAIGFGAWAIGGGNWQFGWGSQDDEESVYAIRHALDKGINWIDTAAVYGLGHSEEIVARALEGRSEKPYVFTKCAMTWGEDREIVRTLKQIRQECEASLRRLKLDVIDLYQIHWPERHVPLFGNMYYDPAKETSKTPIHEQLEALGKLVKAGKVRAIGLSNETPYGVHEFVRLAEQHGLPRVATVQNVYSLISRGHENGLDETMHRLGVSLLAYSPLAFGLLTGKYDQSGIEGPDAPKGARISSYESVRKQRWGRPDSLRAAKRYNQLARDNGLTPTQLALAFCYTKWQVASTIIGVTSVAQLDEDLDAWGTTLSPELLAEIDQLRWEMRDPAA